MRYSGRSTASSLVLIDTWWNVNRFRLYNPVLRLYVLIDTWWNVNSVQVFL